MKKDWIRFGILLVVITALVIGVGTGAVYAEPLLVMQPAYAGMQFHIHQPMGIPVNWYATYDGYPVWKGAEGVWFYGSYTNNAIVQTNYIVGSIVPSVVGISPYVVQTQVAAAPAPAVQTQVVAAPAPVVQTQVMAAAYSAPAVVTAAVPAEYFPRPVRDPSFMALGTWRGNVDRVGILAQPSIPVAWSGMRPKVVYAWTGSRWYQMTASEGERPGDILKSNLYVLTRLVHQNGNYYWQMPDVAYLINKSAQWGYIWMGVVGPNPQHVY